MFTYLFKEIIQISVTNWCTSIYINICKFNPNIWIVQSIGRKKPDQLLHVNLICSWIIHIINLHIGSDHHIRRWWESEVGLLAFFQYLRFLTKNTIILNERCGFLVYLQFSIQKETFDRKANWKETFVFILQKWDIYNNCILIKIFLHSKHVFSVKRAHSNSVKSMYRNSFA